MTSDNLEDYRNETNVRTVHNTKLPVPHIEHPKDNEHYPLRISFLDQQTVQTAHVVFMTQLSYKFENWQGMRPYNFRPTILLMLIVSRLCTISRTSIMLQIGLLRRHSRGQVQGPRRGVYKPESPNPPWAERQTSHALLCQFPAWCTQTIRISSS